MWQGYHQPNWAEMAVLEVYFVVMQNSVPWSLWSIGHILQRKKLFFALFENLPEKVFLFLPPGLYFCYVCDIMFALIILYQHLLKTILEWFTCLLYFDMSA